MISRYTRAEMGSIWNQENRFEKMLIVEVAVAETQAELQLIPQAAAKAIRTSGSYSVERIHELEKTTKHDVIAFVTNVAENIGPLGRYVHFGLTSSDVLDTAMALLVRDAGSVLYGSLGRLEESLLQGAQRYAETLCAGRTHGMHAEPTSFGMKLAGFYAEMVRNRERFERAISQMMIVKLSGAVGTYSTQTEQVEDGVGEKLALMPERIATQVVPRDRHAEVLWSLAMIGAGLERLAIELRHLQRTEVGEVCEGFAKGQKGSSAMPHKKNPISAENITGCARLLRAYAQSAMENIALWHERDISHSSVERVVFPDAFILCDYACDRAALLVQGLEIDESRMRANMEFSQGQLYSSHLLLALVDKGLTREEAYSIVQKLSHKMKRNGDLKSEAATSKEVRAYLSEKEIQKVFTGEKHVNSIRMALVRAGILSPSIAKDNAKDSAKNGEKPTAKMTVNQTLKKKTNKTAKKTKARKK